MSRIIAIAAIAACVAGCAQKMIQEGMDGMMGQPLSAVVAKLGVPDEERTIAGNKVYIWQRRTLVEGTERMCKIRVTMNGAVIGTWDYEGHNATCLSYATRLQS